MDFCTHFLRSISSSPTQMKIEDKNWSRNIEWKCNVKICHLCRERKQRALSTFGRKENYAMRITSSFLYSHPDCACERQNAEIKRNAYAYFSVYLNTIFVNNQVRHKDQKNTEKSWVGSTYLLCTIFIVILLQYFFFLPIQLVNLEGKKKKNDRSEYSGNSLISKGCKFSFFLLG